MSEIEHEIGTVRIAGRSESLVDRYGTPFVATPQGRHKVILGGFVSTSAPSGLQGQELDAWIDASGRLHVVVENDQDPAQAFINATASGDTQMVAASAGNRIRVKWAFASNNNDVPIQIHFRSSDTAITANHTLSASGGGFLESFHPHYFCQTVAGEALDLNLATGGAVGVTIGYELVAT